MPKQPLFIGGAGRSGTTMLGALLGGAQGAVTTPESLFKNRLLTSGCPDAQAALKRLEKSWRFRLWKTPLNTDEINGLDPRTTAADLLLWLVDRYATKENKPEWSCWIDHSPCNIRQVPTLLTHFPDAKFIHIVRDGRAIMASFFNLTWGPAHPKSAAESWLRKLTPGLAAECAYPDRVLRVRYEDLIEEPKKTLQSICAFANLPYREEMLTGSGFAVPEYTRHQHTLVGGGVDKSAAGRWKKQLTERDIELFESIACDMLEYLGYQKLLKPRDASIKMTRYERYIHYPYRKYLHNLGGHLQRKWAKFKASQ